MLLDAVRWINPASGDWGVAANWDAGRVPGGGDDAIIDRSGIIVTHASGTDAVHSLTIANGTFTLSGGSLDLMNSTLQGNSTLNLTGGTLNHAMIPRGITLSGSTIANSIITGNVIGTTDGGTLSGVTLNGDLDLTTPATRMCNQSCTYVVGLVYVTNGLTLNGTARIGGAGAMAYDNLVFLGTQTLGGHGSIIFGPLPPIIIGSQSLGNFLGDAAFATFTIGSTIAVNGKYGDIGADDGGPFINQGTITADTAGGTIVVNFGDGGRNTGTLQAQGGDLRAIGSDWTNPGGTLTLASGTLELGGLNNSSGRLALVVPAGGALRFFDCCGLKNTGGVFTITAAEGGTVMIAGTIANTVGTVNLSGAGVFELAGGSINGGTIAETNGAVLVGSAGADISELNGVTLDGDLNLTRPATVPVPSTVFISGGLTLNGTLRIGGHGHLAYGSLYFLDTETLNGNGHIVFGPLPPRTIGFQSFSNTLSTGRLGSTLTISSAITIDGKYGVIDCTSGANLVNQGTMDADVRGGTISIRGPWTNNGIVEAQNGGTLSATTPANYAGGTLSGGTWQVYDKSTLRITMDTGLVNNAATLILDGPRSHFYQDPTGTTDALAALTTNTGSLTLQAGRSLNLTGDFRDTGILTIGDGSTLTINGTYTEQGSVTVQAGASLIAAGAFANFDGATLTGGTYDISGTFQFTNAAVVTNAATLILDGPDAQVIDQNGNDGLAGSLVANAAGASLTLQDDANLTTPGDFNNAGSLDIMGTVTVAGAFANSGSLILSGTLTLTAGGSYTQTAGGSSILSGGTLTAATVNLQGGIVTGSGTITGNVTNAAEIDVGGAGAIGQLAIAGDYTQTAAGILNLEVGGYDAGSGFDQLTISGQATLDGTLNVSLLNGFVPMSGDAFSLLTFASATGTFADGTIDPAFGPPCYDPMDMTLVAR